MNPDPELEEIEKNLRGARNILLTINVICAFLFILVFELVFAWQPLRPSASKMMFAENLAKLAKMEPKPNSFDKGIVTLAREHSCRILLPYRACLDSLIAEIRRSGELESVLVSFKEEYPADIPESDSIVYNSLIERFQSSDKLKNAWICFFKKKFGADIPRENSSSCDNKNSLSAKMIYRTTSRPDTVICNSLVAQFSKR